MRYLFGIVGSTFLDVLDALYDDRSVEYINVRHEQAAAFMAVGLARESRPGGSIDFWRVVDDATSNGPKLIRTQHSVPVTRGAVRTMLLAVIDYLNCWSTRADTRSGESCPRFARAEVLLSAPSDGLTDGITGVPGCSRLSIDQQHSPGPGLTRPWRSGKIGALAALALLSSTLWKGRRAGP